MNSCKLFLEERVLEGDGNLIKPVLDMQGTSFNFFVPAYTDRRAVLDPEFSFQFCISRLKIVLNLLCCPQSVPL